jgi:hypothetical protein
MRPYTFIGIILIAIGIVSFAYEGINYKTREKVVDIGPVEVTSEKTKTFPLPPIVGAVALVGGIVLLLKRNKKGMTTVKQKEAAKKNIKKAQAAWKARS